MIMEFKARLFCAATKLPRQEIDPSDPLWATRINNFFNGQRGFSCHRRPGRVRRGIRGGVP
jgi:hypothetical protein